MRATVSNVVTVYDATKEFIAWCNKELVLPNPEYAARASMGLWVRNTPKTISLYEKRGDVLVLPFGTLRMIPKRLTDQIQFKSELQNKPQVQFLGKDVPLYDYQKVAVEAMYRAQYGILQSAPGSGKTQMGLALAKKFERRALWLTHSTVLLGQSRVRGLQYFHRRQVGTITGGEVDIGRAITFATVQTMARLDLSKYRDVWDTVIVDECHRVAGTPTAVTQFYKVLNALNARHKIGLSATVHRSDGMIKATKAVLGEVMYVVPDEVLADRIMKVGVIPVATGVGIKRDYFTPDGRWDYTANMREFANDKERNAVIINQMIENKGKSSLILCHQLKHLENLLNMLPEDMRKDAVMVKSASTKWQKEERRQAIEDMKTGKLKYLFATYNLAKEGLDIPRLERLYLATPQKDYAVVTQSLGRIARTHKNKKDAIAYDFVDNYTQLLRSFKERCKHYESMGAYFVKVDEDD